MYSAFMIPLLLLLSCGGSSGSDQEPTPEPDFELTVVPAVLSMPSHASEETILVSANVAWTVHSDKDWCIPSPEKGHSGATGLKISALSNHLETSRTAVLTFASGDNTVAYTLSQEAAKTENYVPTGYTLVWQDEFNSPRTADGKPAMPNLTDWWFETGNHGWGNNELQNYVDRIHGTDTCAVVTDGTLKIIAKKIENQVVSIRMNTKESWKYGYFEAKLKLPAGKGTWPAFWMLPKDFKNWPADGEIDIMEEVGYRPNWTSSAIHCVAYNHSIGTQKTGEQLIETAQTDFHIYALKWTEDYIECFVDGMSHFKFLNDKTNNKDSWPFDVPFYVKLNLAWGGNWGGAHGVDESILPAIYEIDYVRVYQQK